MPSIAFFLQGTGALLMLHAAYSCMHYRSLLQDMDLLTEQAADNSFEETSTESSTNMLPMIPPLDIYFELGLAFLLVLGAELLAMGPLQSVDLIGSKHKPLSAPAHRTRDFDIYSNRSRILLKRA